ncbi:AsnC family transcriptional regulator [Corynebacterium glutamicum]|uniref:AsnC family transcriptional regulator n=1 Tax=Corynebacterium glutamicum TaxID=1718 RepID=UPI0009B5D358|nr:AsnC family transcriptional regulator [Corynebacterium glutamicum]
MPNKDIAAKVGVAPSTCLERIRRMRRNGTSSRLAPMCSRACLARASRRFSVSRSARRHEIPPTTSCTKPSRCRRLLRSTT